MTDKENLPLIDVASIELILDFLRLEYCKATTQRTREALWARINELEEKKKLVIQ